MNDGQVRTSLNVYDCKTNVNTQVMVGPPVSYRGAITKNKYNLQCMTMVQDPYSKKHVAVMSYTLYNPDDPNDHRGFTFTCELNNPEVKALNASIQIVESESNNDVVTSQYNSTTDMCSIGSNVYVVHENVRKRDEERNQIQYPLTIRSNYQQIGDWNMAIITANAAASETETFIRFMNSILELKKIFILYPSMILFLQNIDYRENSDKITRNVLEKMFNDLDASVEGGRRRDDFISSVIPIELNCNEIYNKANSLLWLFELVRNVQRNFVFRGGGDDNFLILGYIKHFYDNFIFLLIYAGCVNVAQFICNNYVELVSSPADPGDDIQILTLDNWKERFMKTFDKYNELKQFKPLFEEKATQFDVTLNIIICSNPETHAGIAYVKHGINNNLVALTANHQGALQHNIFKIDEDFFNANDVFYSTLMASDAVNTVDQINFCSFYKFQRFQNDGNPFITNFGSMMNETVYVSMNIVIDGDTTMASDRVLQFLKIIIKYFKGLPSGAPILNIGMSGPVKRIIFGGDFGCNLMHDSEVCAQFAKYGMTIYTMPKNASSFIDVTNVSANQMFVVDVNLENVPSASSASSSGGGRGIKRLTIGEPIESIKKSENKNENVKLLIINNNNRKKTRRRHK